MASIAAAMLLFAFTNRSLATTSLEVQLQGLSGETLANVTATLSIYARQQDEELDRKAINSLHQKAPWEIRRALQPFGFYQPIIKSTLEQPDNTRHGWRARYAVDTGQPVPISDVHIALKGPGAASIELNMLLDAFPLQENDILDHRQYESAKRNLLAQLLDRGYLDAKYTQHIVEVDMAAYTASINLELVTGAQYIYGPVSFAPSPFASEYLRDYLLLQPGQPYRPAALAKQRTALSKSGHFSEVVISPGPTAGRGDTAIPVDIALTPVKPNRYRGRVGWGTDYGLGAQLDWTRRYIGRHGHRMSLGVTAVEDRNRAGIDASYIIPTDPLSGSRLDLVFRHESKDLTFDEVDLDEGGETRINTNLASLFWHLPTTRWGDFAFRKRLALSRVEETYDVFEVLFGNLPDSTQQAIVETIGEDSEAILSPDFEAFVPNLRLSLHREDDPLYIRRGDYYNLELMGANENMGSNITFAQARLDTWNIFPVGEHHRLLLRTSLGYTEAESKTALGVNFNQMPEYYEFRAGGARSVRGYGFESLFAADTITGGKHLAVASVEYEHQFFSGFSAALFIDAGNAFNDFDAIDEKLGAGIGLRWKSPVGMARIDFGFPLDDAEESFQFYITIGPEY